MSLASLDHWNRKTVTIKTVLNKNGTLDVINKAWTDPESLKWGLHPISATMVADKQNYRFQTKYFYQYFQILSILTIMKA